MKNIYHGKFSSKNMDNGILILHSFRGASLRFPQCFLYFHYFFYWFTTSYCSVKFIRMRFVIQTIIAYQENLSWLDYWHWNNLQKIHFQVDCYLKSIWHCLLLVYSPWNLFFIFYCSDLFSSCSIANHLKTLWNYLESC